MEVIEVPGVTLSFCEGLTIPVIGMGTSSSPPAGPEATKAAIMEAIKAGYRHFDTASLYNSEQPLGEAIAEALHLGLIKSRDELYISSKLWCTSANKDLVVPAIRTSLRYNLCFSDYNQKFSNFFIYFFHVKLCIVICSGIFSWTILICTLYIGL